MLWKRTRVGGREGLKTPGIRCSLIIVLGFRVYRVDSNSEGWESTQSSNDTCGACARSFRPMLKPRNPKLNALTQKACAMRPKPLNPDAVKFRNHDRV